MTGAHREGVSMRNLPTIVALLGTTTIAFAADPVGGYSLAGTNPGNKSQYHGRVTVERTGKTYRVVWVVGGTRYVGTGIGTDR